MRQTEDDNRMVLDKRVNIVSVANLVALIGLLLSALATWYGLVGRVDNLSFKVEAAMAEMARMRTESNEALRARDTDMRDLRVKTDLTANRLSVVETQVGSINNTLSRIEQRFIASDKPPVQR